MATFNTINDIPTSGTSTKSKNNYKNLEIKKKQLFVDPTNPKRQATTFIRGWEPRGFLYDVEYLDSGGEKHKSSLTGFLQRRPEIKIQNIPQDFTEGIKLSGGQTPKNFISTTEQGNVKSNGKASGFIFGNDVLDKKANNAAVNQLYQSYFNRDATQPELDNWGEKGGSDTTVRSLEDFLKKERSDAEAKGIKLPNIRSINEVRQGISPDQATDTSDVTGDITSDDLTNLQADPNYQLLSDDLKALIETMQVAMTSRDAEVQANAQEALEQAKEIVDPFMKVMLQFSLDSIPDQFRIQKQSLEDQLKSKQETLGEINTLMKEAGIEETQELDALRRNYEQQVTNIEDQVADTGLTFSSKRSDLERFIGEQNIDIQRSTERGFDKKLRNLDQVKSETERQNKLIREAGEAQLKTIARGAEETLGTDRFKELGLKGLSGQDIQSIGGQGDTPAFAGTLEQQRRAKILDLSGRIEEFGSPSQIKQLFNL